MNKIITLLLVFFIFVGCNSKENNNNLNFINEENIFIISEEDFLNSYASNNNISFLEASYEVKRQRDEILKNNFNYLEVYEDEKNVFYIRHEITNTYIFNKNFLVTRALDIEIMEFRDNKFITNASVNSYLNNSFYDALWEETTYLISPNGGEFPTDSIGASTTGVIRISVNNRPFVNTNIEGFNVVSQNFTKTNMASEPIILSGNVNLSDLNH